mmetsp:Transcript_25361/g.57292  ORF Transcript_25361/g.57292 Transcript_25361/m.57292 type:complete len:303 (-) Transcript_25361:323-1231(-)
MLPAPNDQMNMNPGCMPKDTNVGAFTVKSATMTGGTSQISSAGAISLLGSASLISWMGSSGFPSVAASAGRLAAWSPDCSCAGGFCTAFVTSSWVSGADSGFGSSAGGASAAAETVSGTFSCWLPSSWPTVVSFFTSWRARSRSPFSAAAIRTPEALARIASFFAWFGSVGGCAASTGAAGWSSAGTPLISPSACCNEPSSLARRNVSLPFLRSLSSSSSSRVRVPSSSASASAGASWPAAATSAGFCSVSGCWGFSAGTGAAPYSPSERCLHRNAVGSAGCSLSKALTASDRRSSTLCFIK